MSEDVREVGTAPDDTGAAVAVPEFPAPHEVPEGKRAYLPARYVICLERKDLPGVVVGYAKANANPMIGAPWVWTQDVWQATRAGTYEKAEETRLDLDYHRVFPGFNICARRLSVALDFSEKGG